MPGNFHVFSLDAPSQVRDHKKRRPHKKTKSGCLSCKVKKIKCDQAKPVCVRCQRKGLPCSYGPYPSSVPSSSIPQALPRPLHLSPFPPSPPSCGTSPQALLHHFELNWDSIFIIPRFGGPHNSGTPLVHLANGRPHLLNALLAVSASHLRHHAPNPNSHRLAEHFQQSIALRSFNELLQKPMSSLPPDETSVLLLTAILFNLLTFALPADEDPSLASAAASEQSDPDPSRSWVFSTRPTRLDWLAVQLGLRELVIASLPFRNQWETTDCQTRDPPLTVAEARDAAIPAGGLELDDRVPDAWLEVFGIGRKPIEGWRRRYLLDPPERKEWHKKEGFVLQEDAEMRDQLFREPLFLLAEIRGLAPTMANIFRYLQFLGRLEPEFKDLLYNRDERALWAFGYWLGLVCRLDYIWWVTRRARRDFMAILIWLRSRGVTNRPGREGLLWTELMSDLESLYWEPRGTSEPRSYPGHALEWSGVHLESGVNVSG